MSYNPFVTNIVPLFNVTSNGSGPTPVVNYDSQIAGFETMLNYNSYTLTANTIIPTSQTYIDVGSDLYISGQLYINTYPIGPDANGSNFTAGTSYTVKTTSSHPTPIQFITNNIVAFSIDSNANAVFANSLTSDTLTCQKLYQVSDQQYTDSTPIISSLSTLVNLTGVQYGLQLGFIPQDVNTILPSAVNLNQRSIDYSQFIPLLIESVKELKTQLSSLELVVKGLM